MNKKQQYDVVVIGAGVLGCFAARNLTRYKLKILLLEAESDVCTGITKANSAIIYAGYDHVPGSLKAEFTLAGNASMEKLCQELDVPFKRRGSLMTACGPRGDRILKKKLEQGMANDVPGLKFLSGEEAKELEPMLWNQVTSALWAPSTATVNPWQLGIAAYENAVQNGCNVKLNTRVMDIHRDEDGYVLETDGEAFHTRMVLNLAGLSADKISELLFPPRIRLELDASDFLVFDRRISRPSHILFQETEEKGKGITAVPSAEGNLLVESPSRELTVPFATEAESLALLKEKTLEYLPELDMTGVVRSFGAVRPNPYYVKEEKGIYVREDKRITSFVIDRPEPGFISLIGIKTPGLTCADQLGRHLADTAADYLNAEMNDAFHPERRKIKKPMDLEWDLRNHLIKEEAAYGEILCQCEGITRGEVMEAVCRGARDLNGIRRRLGLGMGTCQGSRCRRGAENLLKEVLHGTF